MAKRPKVDPDTSRLLDWLSSLAKGESGVIPPYTNGDALKAVGRNDLKIDGTHHGNVQSRVDFACFRNNLPPLGLTAVEAFPNAWASPIEGWRFPIARMKAAAQSRRWTDDDFDRLRATLSDMPGQAGLLWKETMLNELGRVQAWADGLQGDADPRFIRTLDPSRKSQLRLELPLSKQGQDILAVLVGILPRVDPADPRTFIGYKEVHTKLGLDLVAETYGLSLKAQGLLELAEWTANTSKPGITGLVIDLETLSPGLGYFKLFNRDPDDFSWRESEIERSRQFNWEPYIPAPAPPMSPLASDANCPPERQELTTYRVLRDTLIARRVKQLHNYECQLCGHSILFPDGNRYAEAHHIRPLGKPHDGPDKMENIICLCPNHHAELDYGVRPLIELELRHVNGHALGNQFIDYHNTSVWKKV